jgi:hypothetical protein
MVRGPYKKQNAEISNWATDSKETAQLGEAEAVVICCARQPRGGVDANSAEYTQHMPVSDDDLYWSLWTFSWGCGLFWTSTHGNLSKVSNIDQRLQNSVA